MQQAIIQDQLCHLQPDEATFIEFFFRRLYRPCHHFDRPHSEVAFIFFVFQTDAGVAALTKPRVLVTYVLVDWSHGTHVLIVIKYNTISQLWQGY